MRVLVVTENWTSQGERHVDPHLVLHSCRSKKDKPETEQRLLKVPLPPENECHLTSERLKFHKAATTAAVQHFVFGRCGMGLSMCTDFDHAIACVVHFVLRTQSHLRMEKSEATIVVQFC